MTTDEEIGETEKTVSGLLHSLDNKTFIIYHPALTYLANEYGLTQLCIEMDGKEPSPAQLKELVETARNIMRKSCLSSGSLTRRTPS